MNTDIWNDIKSEVKLRVNAEPSLKPYLESLILSQDNFINSIASILASKLNSNALSSQDIKRFVIEVYNECDWLEEALIKDLLFFKENDPAFKYY